MTDTTEVKRFKVWEPGGFEFTCVRASDYDALAAKLAQIDANFTSAEWGDNPDDLTPMIKADFRSDGFYDRYAKAQNIVGNRYSKGSLVALVCYMLKAETERDAARAALVTACDDAVEIVQVFHDLAYDGTVGNRPIKEEKQALLRDIIRALATPQEKPE